MPQKVTRKRTSHAVRLVLADGSTQELGPEQAALVDLALRDEDTLTPAEAAKVLGVSRPMVSKWLADRVLPDSPVGSHHRIPREAVLALKEQRIAATRDAMDALAAADAGDAHAARSVALAKVASTRAAEANER